MIVSSDRDRENLVEAGKRLARVLGEVSARVAPGVSAEELDNLAERLIRDGGDEPAFLGYRPEGARRPYPAALCVSVNDEVVHGIPNEGRKILKEGDIVGLDLGLTYGGIVVDAAVTVPVGATDDGGRRLIRAAEAALAAGIAQAVPGNRLGDVSHAIQEEIERAGFAAVRELGGHGIGTLVHEEPFISNVGRAGTGMLLVEGMTLALEPIASEGRAAVVLASDGYTYRTKDGSRSAHFEHTILLEKGGTRIITA